MERTHLVRLVLPLAAFAGMVPALAASRNPLPELFATSDRCQACHNGVSGPDGRDLSIGLEWRPTMMANASRDPYWQAGVRRELLDHPESQAAIEAECSTCHMAMARQTAVAGGGQGEVFANLPAGMSTHPTALLAADGVSCSACHQVLATGLGEKETFNGRFTVDYNTPAGERAVFGPVTVDPPIARVMRSATGYDPRESAHIQEATLCASCHTLITHSLGPRGKVLGEFPEQVPYLEWKHSDYEGKTPCQTCHMPVVDGEVPFASVLGDPREGFARHAFMGGNFFLSRVFARFQGELGVTAGVQDFERSHAATVEHLQAGAARLSVACDDGPLAAVVTVENLAGHKLPTAYPSRRAWLHVTIRDPSGAIVLESGKPSADGSIAGNDNDADALAYEAHHAVIRSADDVQIYETIMADPEGGVTTGLLTAVRYAKDNRLLPTGFDKTTAEAFVAVHGKASSDADFAGGSDQVRYEVAPAASGAYLVEAALWYQPVGYRWAHNLGAVSSMETDRFVRYYDALAQASGV
ncbi:MAG: hypothetical protein JXB39_00410, partial [Deltaproteobacteria bacterium]|nr:hypothetical protein [Deltaproteobacteria bacterium]